MASTERFGYEWEKFNQILPEYQDQFRRWTYPLKPGDFKGKRILDAGCGMGRNSFWAAKYGAKELLAFDYDHRSVAAAQKNLGAYPQAQVRYQSIYDLDKNNYFDLVFSIGVIHHLTDTRSALKNLAAAARNSGRVLIWVYGREGNGWIIFLINPLRLITSRLPLKLVYLLSWVPATVLAASLRLFPVRHPYLAQLKNFTFDHLRSIVFDHLIPSTARYYNRNQAEKLLTDAGLTAVHSYPVNQNSWTVIGTKK